jgi:hypothetical protein
MIALNKNLMKYSFLFALLLSGFGLFAQDDAIARHFNEYLSDKEFTSAYISPKMFQVMADKTDLAMDDDVRKMIRTMKGMRVVQRTGKDGSAQMKAAGDKLKTARFEELMSLREKGEQIQFYTRGGGSTVQELVMVVAGTQRFLLLSMVGEINLSTVGKLSKSLNLQGVELLDKVK